MSNHRPQDSWGSWNSTNVHEEEVFELDETGNLQDPAIKKSAVKYKDGSSIDWLQEEALERERDHAKKSQRSIRALLSIWADSARVWLVVVATGIGIGVAGAWLDVLVKWLGDLREGRCQAGFFHNQVTCCSGLDPGELCTEWQTWSEYFDVRYIFVQSLLQSSIYVTLAVAFAGSAAVLVNTYAPYPFIALSTLEFPEIKAILGGYVFDAFLTPWTLLIKALGLALAVASGLSLGKEGPLVHVACCMAFMFSQFFKQFKHNEGWFIVKRKLLAASAAAGVSVAFGSPLGGVIFCLEELDTFALESDVMWRGFVASAIAAVSFQYVDPFGTSKLVLFQVTNGGDTWRAFELIPWLGLGVIGGVLGSLMIKLNVEIALYRRNSVLNEYPIVEVVALAAITAAVGFLVVFTRVQSSELVANLFQECDPAKGDYHGLCNPTAMWENIFLLLISAIIKIAFTAWTFGMQASTFRACIGRAVGMLTSAIQTSYPTAWLFLSCPPDPSIRCVSPGFYSVIGASAMLGGVTRMTVSLVVIMFELTGALSHVLPIMVGVMTAKWVGDALGKDGIYNVWIAMRHYPWLPPVDFNDRGQTAADAMRPFSTLVMIEEDRLTLKDIENLTNAHDFRGFPVVRGTELIGLATRDKLLSFIDLHLSPETNSKKCRFYSQKQSISDEFEYLDLSCCLENSIIHLRKEVPQSLLVRMFQKMNLRQILFTHRGQLDGMMTKPDVVALLTAHFPHTGALASSES
ncbi:Cl-channel protein [Gymnopus androsaceus JB14]|uniref:Chloride channel protein n=1 Tax=Gymnopus androsaceus JB14 TaxID=1447944 RepID=A0A6A4HNB1_9AGAR|nr:Cl-channel protein [Gymnopus androsaceus JB14]